MLIAAISVVSTLMGPKTKLRIRKRYSEPCNLFTVCPSEPGAGKSQAFDIAVESPIRQLYTILQGKVYSSILWPMKDEHSWRILR